MSCPKSESFDHPSCDNECKENPTGPRFERTIDCVEMGPSGPTDNLASNCAPDATVYTADNEALTVTKDQVKTTFECDCCITCSTFNGIPTFPTGSQGADYTTWKANTNGSALFGVGWQTQMVGQTQTQIPRCPIDYCNGTMGSFAVCYDPAEETAWTGLDKLTKATLTNPKSSGPR